MGICGVSFNKMDCSAMKMHKISKILEFGMYLEFGMPNFVRFPKTITIQDLA